MLIDTDTLRESMRQMLLRILDAHYEDPDEPSHRAVWIDLTLDHVGDSADVELARSGVWRGTLADWLMVGPGLVRRLPVGRVELVDREPRPRPGPSMTGHAWWGNSFKLPDIDATDRPWQISDGLPHEFFADKKHPTTWHFYDTLALALDDASRRAIAWARGATEGKETA